MVLIHGKALNLQRNLFPSRQRAVLTIRQKFALLNSKGNFDDPLFARFQGLSMSIGRFSTFLARNAIRKTLEKYRQALTTT
jgi:hypothetical protein